jgi:hypothetical protein
MDGRIGAMTMKTYKLMLDGVQRLSDRACIPSDERNRDWRAYQEWLESGNVSLPVDIVVPMDDVDSDAYRAWLAE